MTFDDVKVIDTCVNDRCRDKKESFACRKKGMSTITYVIKLSVGCGKDYMP